MEVRRENPKFFTTDWQTNSLFRSSEDAKWRFLWFLPDQTRFCLRLLRESQFLAYIFDAQLCLKRNLEGNIVPWIVKTYSSLKKFYTIEVEKSPKNHLSPSKRRQKRLFISSPRNNGEQRSVGFCFFQSLILRSARFLIVRFRLVTKSRGISIFEKSTNLFSRDFR